MRCLADDRQEWVAQVGPEATPGRDSGWCALDERRLAAEQAELVLLGLAQAFGAPGTERENAGRGSCRPIEIEAACPANDAAKRRGSLPAAGRATAGRDVHGGARRGNQ